MNCRYVLLFVFLFVVTAAKITLGEEKWGKVSQEILQMASYSEDTSASAVVLFDLGDMEITPEYLDFMKQVVKHDKANLVMVRK